MGFGGPGLGLNKQLCKAQGLTQKPGVGLLLPLAIQQHHSTAPTLTYGWTYDLDVLLGIGLVHCVFRY